jgi:hypothetical protein
MTNNCEKCQGSGVERYVFHGVWPNGEECVEPLKCDECDGIGAAQDEGKCERPNG